jgi:hypothetical protein
MPPRRRHPLLAAAALSLAGLLGATAVRAQETHTPPVAVHREVLANAPERTRFYFSYRPVEDAARNGWEIAGVAFYAFASPAPGSVLVYVESPTIAPHSTYLLSTRTDAEAEQAGWGVRAPAFWAYPSARPGAVPVIVETLISAPNTRFNFSTRSRAEAERDGWRQLGIAFWAPAPPQTAPPLPQPPVFPPERQLPPATSIATDGRAPR